LKGSVRRNFGGAGGIFPIGQELNMLAQDLYLVKGFAVPHPLFPSASSLSFKKKS